MTPYNNDQRREAVNTRQVFESWQDARQRARQGRGSMVWSSTKGIEYLLRSWYPEDRGIRRQVSLGPRSPRTEQLKLDFEATRAASKQRLANVTQKLDRQAAINRVIGLGRLPVVAGRIIQAIDDAGLLGQSLRVVGTHAIYAYEAAAGMFTDSDIATTQDIDLLFDSRMRLRLVAKDDSASANLLQIIRKVDASFDILSSSFRASNDEGYLVDLIKPLRDPAWIEDQIRLSDDTRDLAAVEIEGLIWLENAPKFEAIAIDERGRPLRIVTIDPRVFAVHKLWLSKQITRDPLQRQRDAAQSRVVAQMTVEHFAHLPFEPSELRMLPQPLVDAAAHLFEG